MDIKNQIKFEERNVVFIKIENFSEYTFKDGSIENLVLISKMGNEDAYFDVGALCYKRRTRINRVKHYSYVDKSTFNKHIAKALKNYLSENYLSLTINSTYTILSRLKLTIDDLYNLSEEKSIELKFNDLDHCHIIYENYTAKLVDKVRSGLSRPSFTSSYTYAKKQKICFDLIAANCDLDGKAFKERYTEIKGFSAANIEPKVYNDLDYSIFLSHCKKIFYIFSDFIINNGLFPIRLNIKDDKYDINQYEYMIKNPKGRYANYFLDNKTRRFLTRHETVINAKRIENVEQLPIRFKKSEDDLPYYLLMSYNNYENSILKANESNSKERLKVINLAIASFAMWLILDSGCNRSTIFQMKVKDLKSLKNDTTHHKLMTIKGRAGYKKIKIPLTKKMVKGLQDYVKFREFVINQFVQEEQEFIKDDLFFGFTLNTKVTLKGTVSPFSIKDIELFRSWYSSFFDEESWINPRDIRRSNSNIIKNLNEGIQVAAERMGHSNAVSIKHYSEATKEQTYTQLSEFFDEVYGQIIFKNRNTEKVIPIVTNVECSNTLAGHCRTNEPTRAIGFNDSIELPNCSNPASCLFCEHYVLHTDEIDIRKLISLRKIIDLHPDKNDEMQIVKYRVDEILKYIIDQNKDLIPLISMVKEEVDEGYLDEHWENLMNLFIDLGVDFYA